MLLRSFAVQGSWNYERLIGTGFAYSLLPALRHLRGDDPQALTASVTRHAEVFNSHPYLATVAVGAVARLEADGVDEQLTARFKNALRGSLGAIGDQLVWSAWRPASILLGLVLLLLGAAWWVGVVMFLVVYNALHLGLRAWGLRTGLDRGLEVGRSIREAPLQGIAARAADAGALLAGAAAVLAAGAPGMEPVDLGFGLGGIAAGLWLGLQMRYAAAVIVAAVWSVGVILGILI